MLFLDRVNDSSYVDAFRQIASWVNGGIYGEHKIESFSVFLFLLNPEKIMDTF